MGKKKAPAKKPAQKKNESQKWEKHDYFIRGGGVVALLGIICYSPDEGFGVLPTLALIAAGIALVIVGFKKQGEFKAEKERLEAEKKAEEERKRQEEERQRIEHRQKIDAQREATRNNPEEYARLNRMCKDIHQEYKDLLKEHSSNPNSWQLKECYRKMEVVAETVLWHDCFDDFDPWDEMEKIEEKAKRFVNKCIRDGEDISDLYDDLWFITDYIGEKEEKLFEKDL